MPEQLIIEENIEGAPEAKSAREREVEEKSNIRNVVAEAPDAAVSSNPKMQQQATMDFLENSGILQKLQMA